MWCRIETGGDPVFVGECYFPHATNIQEHRKPWKEIRDVVERTRNMGHIVLMGDFNAHLGMNGDHRVDSAGKLLKEQLNAMRLHVVNGFKECRGRFTREQEKKDTTEQSTVVCVVVSCWMRRKLGDCGGRNGI
jgi:hypothetical protein